MRHPFLLSAALGCAILCCGCRAREEGKPVNAAPAAAWRFPFEPQSESELLAASHLFVFTVVKLTASPWAPGPDGLEHRAIDMRLRLDAPLKGELDAAAGTEFPLRVAAAREPGGVVSDYHGFWSHFEIAEGSAYLALATAPSRDAAALLREPAIKDIVPAARRSEFDFAEAEEKKRPPATADAAAHARALEAIARDIAPAEAGLGSLAASYLLARLGEGDLREGPVADALLEVIVDPGTAPDLRLALANGLPAKAMAQGATRQQRTALARGLFRLAALPQARDAFEQLAAGELYHLIFADEAPDLRAADVVPDAAARKAGAATLKGFDEERADAIAAWLAGP